MPIITNNATATYISNESGEPISLNSNTSTINLKQTENLVISKSASSSTFSNGSIITYTITITNTGPNYLNGIQVIDNLGEGNLAYVLGSANLSTETESYTVTPNSTNPLTFSLQQLNLGETITLNYQAQVIFNLPISVNKITNSVRAIGFTNTNSFTAFASSTISRN